MRRHWFALFQASQIPKKKQIKLAIGILFSTGDGKQSEEEKDTEEYRYRIQSHPNMSLVSVFYTNALAFESVV